MISASKVIPTFCPPEEWIPAQPLWQRHQLPAGVGHVSGDQEEIRELGGDQPTLGIVLLACRGHLLSLFSQFYSELTFNIRTKTKLNTQGLRLGEEACGNTVITLSVEQGPSFVVIRRSNRRDTRPFSVTN